MALPVTVETLDSIPEAARALYEERDGKFVLPVEGMDDVEGLRKALDSARRVEKKLVEKVKPYEALGRGADELAEILRAQEEAEAKRAKESGDTDAILKQHMDKWAKERSQLEEKLNAALSSERSAIVETRIMTALAKANATEEGADLLPDRLAGRVQYDIEDGKRVVRIMTADGSSVMAGNGPGGEATFDDLVNEAKTKWPSLFKGTGAGGSGSPPKTAGRAGEKQMTRADFEKLGPGERATTIRSGVTIID
jgi:hypothetical protein